MSEKFLDGGVVRLPKFDSGYRYKKRNTGMDGQPTKMF